MDRMKLSIAAAELAVIGLLTLLLVNLVTIPLVSPQHKLYTTDSMPELVWGGMQGDYVVLLDDNPKFSTPLTAEVSGNSYTFPQELAFGTYYWKVQAGPMSSEVRRFTLGSSVVLSREGDEVRNEGNTELLVHAPSITGAFMLGVNETVELGAEENVMAEQA